MLTQSPCEMISPSDLKESLQVLFHQEATCYRTDDYIDMKPLGPFSDGAGQSNTKAQVATFAVTTTAKVHNPILGKDPVQVASVSSEHSPSEERVQKQWRQVMCEWAYNLVDHFDLPRELVSICMNIVDRYLFKYMVSPEAPTMNKQHFQLLTLTALYVTIKLDGQTFLSIQSMMHLGRGLIGREQIVHMEQDILFRLDWYVHPPTPFVFLRHYLLLLQREERHHNIQELAMFYLELSVLDYEFVAYPPSQIAMAAILNAIQDEIPMQFSHYYSMLSSMLGTNGMKSVPKCRRCLHYLFCEGQGLDETSSSESIGTLHTSPTASERDTSHPSAVDPLASPVHRPSTKLRRCVTEEVERRGN